MSPPREVVVEAVRAIDRQNIEALRSFRVDCRAMHIPYEVLLSRARELAEHHFLLPEYARALPFQDFGDWCVATAMKSLVGQATPAASMEARWRALATDVAHPRRGGKGNPESRQGTRGSPGAHDHGRVLRRQVAFGPY